MTEEQVGRLRDAIAYTDQIVRAGDGWPMEHSAADMRTLLANAYLAGQDATAERHAALLAALDALVERTVTVRRQYQDSGQLDAAVIAQNFANALANLLRQHRDVG